MSSQTDSGSTGSGSTGSGSTGSGSTGSGSTASGLGADNELVAGDDPFVNAQDLSADSLVAMLRRTATKIQRLGGSGRRSLPPMRESEELYWLHRNWQLHLSTELTGIPRNVAGVKAWLRARLLKLAFSQLERPLLETQDVISHSVRLLDALSVRADTLAEIEDGHYRQLRAELDEISRHLRLLGGGTTGHTFSGDPEKHVG